MILKGNNNYDKSTFHLLHIYKISGTSIHLSNKCIQTIGRSYLKSVREKFYVYSIRGNIVLSSAIGIISIIDIF